MSHSGRHGIHRPTLEDFVFEGEEVPLLLRGRVIAALVAAFLLITGVYVGVSISLGISWEIDAEPFKDWVDDFGVWGPIVFIVVMALSVLIAPIPNAPVFIAAGLAWGPVIGSLYSMAGLMAGSSIAFYASRWLGRRHLPRLIGGRAAARLDHIADTMGGRVVFWARLLPAVNFDWISFLAGLTSIRFLPFVVASFFGFLIPTSLTVAAGDGLGRDIRITIVLFGIWLAAIAASAAFFWYRRRRWQARRRESGASANAGDELGTVE